MSGLRLRVVIVWGRRCARCVALVQIYNSALLIPNLNRTSPPGLHLRSYNIVHLCVLMMKMMMIYFAPNGTVPIGKLKKKQELKLRLLVLIK